LITGIVALPLLVGFIRYAPASWFSVFIALCTFLGMQELYRMSIPSRRAEGILGSLAGGAAILLFPGGYVLPVFTGFFLLFSLLMLFRFRDIRDAGGELALLLLPLLYVPLLLGHLVLIRQEPAGIRWIFFLLLLIMAGDTAAYYVGSSLGKNRLYPEVSPKKSVEGAIGGLAGSVAAAFIAGWTFLPGISVSECVLLPLVLGPLGQLGDLFESLLKRSFGVKDSGGIIPGHGGILDRLDSLLFSAPVLFYYLSLR
ncbi:MAG TPA: phosphatidate cytidylyltransferase, partial [Verrucomicrobiae bacterium]|nr:phosphatidate cytidylyltransferase [Verrucomicrobiae bacterium]